MAALDKYLRVRGSHPHADTPWLWLGKRGRLTDSGVLQVVEKLGRAAGIAGLHPHVFRHTFAHNSLSAGMGEGDVMAPSPAGRTAPWSSATGGRLRRSEPWLRSGAWTRDDDADR